MTKTVKKMAAVALSAAMLSTAVAVTLPWALADGAASQAPDARGWKVATVEDFDSMEAGASYPNWDSYYSRAADEAKAGAGYNESQGLYIHSLESGDGKTYVQPYYAMGKEGSFSNAQELWIWFDFTGYTAKDINIRPRVTGLPEGESTGVQYNLALTSDAPIYYQADDGTVTVSSASTVLKDGAVNPLGDAKLRGADLTGFKGFVRIPLSSFHVQNKADKIDTGYSITKVDGIYFIYDFTMAVDDNEDYVETGYVMDQVLFVGHDGTHGIDCRHDADYPILGGSHHRNLRFHIGDDGHDLLRAGSRRYSRSLQLEIRSGSMESGQRSRRDRRQMV